MSDQDNRTDRNLMPVGRCDLAPVAAANALVSRGLSDVTHDGLLKVKSESALVCLLLGQDLDEAIRLYDEVIRLKPKNSFAYLNRGVAWLQKSQSGLDKEACGKAINDFNQAVRLEPACSSTYTQRGVAWYYKKDYHNAIKDVGEALRLSSTSESENLDGKVTPERVGQIAAEAMRKLWKRFGIMQLDELCEKLHELAAVARPLVINLPGALSVQLPTGGSRVVLAETPGTVEINRQTIADAYRRTLFKRKQRLEKLIDLNAPQIILQNELRMLNCCEGVCKNSDHNLAAHEYDFRLQEGYFQCSEFAKELQNLSAFTPLVSLDLAHCPVTDKGLAYLRYLPDLRVLDLENCVEITDDGLAYLAVLPGLQSLLLTGCSVTDRGLSHLAGLKDLKWLRISGCDMVTQDGVRTFMAVLPQCQID